MPGNAQQASQGDYRLLGLPYGASPDEVKKAYKAFVKAWHPDRFPQGSRRQRRAEDRLKDVNAAYRRIRDDWERDVTKSRPEPTGPAPPSDERQREPVTHRANPPSSVPAFPWKQAWERVFRRFHPFKVSRRWLMLLLLLPLLAVLMELEPSLPPDDRRASHQSRQPDLFPPGGPLPTPLEAPQTTSLPEPSGQIPQPSPKVPEDRPPFPDPALQGREQIFFTLGSTKTAVQRIQGKPDKILGQTWVYGLSDVTFREGRVWRYHNFDGALKVSIVPSAPPASGRPPESFALGATRDEVLWVQGTPTHVEGNKWSYGFSEVFFKDGLVIGFNNFFNNLRVLMQPSPGFGTPGGKGTFTIGSTQDEVLALQGTPTMIQGNLWSYELSDVLFAEGKVRSVSDFSGILLYSQPDSRAEKSSMFFAVENEALPSGNR